MLDGENIEEKSIADVEKNLLKVDIQGGMLLKKLREFNSLDEIFIMD